MNKNDAFVKHIQDHLTRDEVVICKICGETIDTIYRKQLTEEEKQEEEFENLHPNVSLMVIDYTCCVCGITNRDNIEKLPVSISIDGEFCEDCRKKFDKMRK